MQLLQEFEEWFVELGHCVDNEFYEATILEVVVFGETPMCEHVAEGTFAVGARSADILNEVGVVDIFWAEGVEDLFQLHTGRYIVAEIGEVQGVHDSEPGTTAAAIVIYAVRIHFFEATFWQNSTQDFALRFYDTHLANIVAWVMQGDWEVVLGWIEIVGTTQNEIAEQRQEAFDRYTTSGWGETVGNDGCSLVSMAAFCDDDTVYTELLSSFHLSQSNFLGEHIVIPDTIVDVVIAAEVGAEGPVEAGFIEEDGESSWVFWPSHEFTSVVDQQDISAVLVDWGLVVIARIEIVEVFIQKFYSVNESWLGDTSGRTGLQLKLGALFAEWFWNDTEFLAEDLADFFCQGAVIETEWASLCAATAKVAAVCVFTEAHNGFPVQINVCTSEPCFELAFFVDVFFDQTTQNFDTPGWAIDLVSVSRNKDVAGIGAGVALCAVFNGQIQYLDHTFVGFVVDEFFKAAQELVAKFFLFFRGLRLLEVVKSDDTVELSIVGVAPFRFHFFVFWPRCRIFKRCRQRHEVLVVKNRCELFASDCDVTWTNKSSVDQDYSSFRKQIELR